MKRKSFQGVLIKVIMKDASQRHVPGANSWLDKLGGFDPSCTVIQPRTGFGDSPLGTLLSKPNQPPALCTGLS